MAEFGTQGLNIFVCNLFNTLSELVLCSHHIIHVLFPKKQHPDVVGHHTVAFHDGTSDKTWTYKSAGDGEV